MKPKKQKFLPGNQVKVRSFSEIIATLNQNGSLDELPFMPEMAKYCGRHYRVKKRIERTCEEIEGTMRRIQNVVFLDNLRCDGSKHGGCQKGCLLFWKESWLTEVADDSNFSYLQDNQVEDPRINDLPCMLGDNLYICQATELLNATTPLSAMDIKSYIRDIYSHTYTFPQLIGILSYAFFLRIRYYLTGIPYQFLKGSISKTPEASLNLQPGEWVQVKTKEEIRKTLDLNGMNHGLRFTSDMIPSCGGSYRVLRRLEQMIHEPTRKLIKVRDTVILEDSICKGCHIIKGGCPRENFNFWREIWLERMPNH